MKFRDYINEDIDLLTNALNKYRLDLDSKKYIDDTPEEDKDAMRYGVFVNHLKLFEDHYNKLLLVQKQLGINIQPNNLSNIKKDIKNSIDYYKKLYNKLYKK